MIIDICVFDILNQLFRKSPSTHFFFLKNKPVTGKALFFIVLFCILYAIFLKLVFDKIQLQYFKLKNSTPFF